MSKSNQISCRNFLGKAGAFLTDFLLFSIRPSWASGKHRLKSSLPHKYRYHDPVAASPRWDYARVPFQNFEMLETSDKPVLSLSSASISRFFQSISLKQAGRAYLKAGYPYTVANLLADIAYAGLVRQDLGRFLRSSIAAQSKRSVRSD